MSDVIHTDLLPLPELDTHVIGKKISCFIETDSTNALALEACMEGAVFVTEHQTAGRGRHGKRWHSASGLGLWFSVCLAGPLPGVNFAAALAVRDAVANALPLTVKWPNDLYAGSGKVCGILLEQRHEWIALGIGLNVNHKPDDFPPALRHRASSLALATGRYWDRRELLVRLLETLDRQVCQLRQGESNRIREEWIQACDIIGRHIRRGVVYGRVIAVEDDGALVVQTRTGLHRVTDGDIFIVD